MTDRSIHNHIRDALSRGEITPAELRELAEQAPESDAGARQPDNSDMLVHVLSYIGGTVILIGVVIFVVLQWELLHAGVRILISLGGGIVVYSVGAVLLSTKGKAAYLPHAFFLIAAVLIPTGLCVFVYEFGFDLGEPGVQTALAAGSAAFFAASFALLKRLHIFLVLTIIFSTWFIVSLLTWLTHGGQLLPLSEASFYVWLVVLLGVTYILLARGLMPFVHRALGVALEVVGATGVMLAPLIQGRGWDIVYPLLVAGGFAGSIYLMNRGVLVLSSLFLVIYLIKVTSHYFADSVGWPVALIAIGAVILAVSYGTYHLHRSIRRRQHTAAEDEQHNRSVQ